MRLSMLDMRLEDAFGYPMRFSICVCVSVYACAFELFEGMVKVYGVCVYGYPYACAFWVCVIVRSILRNA